MTTSAELWGGLAGPDDDAELRRLMRDTPMQGSVSLAFAREPSYFHAAGVEGATDTIVGREPGGRVVAAFSRSVRPCWVGGEPRSLPYLSALRVDPGYRLRPALLKRGFDWVRQLQEADRTSLPWAVTTIVSDNAPARRILEAGLKGLPRYLPQEELITFAAPTWRRRYRAVPGLEVRDARPDDLDGIVAVLAAWGRRHRFGPVWDAASLLDPIRCRDLRLDDFVVATRGGAMVGVVALWDQSGFKQTVVHGYSGALGRFRRVVNAVAPVVGVPRLPDPGQALRHAYLSHLAVPDLDPDVARAVLTAAHDRARPRGYGYLTWMLAARHPLVPVVKATFRPMEYRSMAYAVAWGPAEVEGARLAQPEVAVL